MPTASFIRYCICSLLVFTLIYDCAAQRTARRRSVTVNTPIVELLDAQVQTRERSPKEAQFTGDPFEKDIDLNKELTSSAAGLCRETISINKENVADSYPYLTDDGLRLYSTSNREGGHGRFFIATRKSLSDPFESPKVLSRNLTDGYYAGTLTANELTLCMVNSGAMYISTRANKNEEFSLPVKLEGATDQYHFGPSISPDGNQIFVTVTVDGKDRTRIYQRTGPNKVAMLKELLLPEGSEAGPGQLSKDGLSYYLSIDVKTQEHLWRYTRKSLNDDFGNLTELPGQAKEMKNLLQPSLNADGSVMVFVTSPNNLWDGDDIMLVNNWPTHISKPELAANLADQVGATITNPRKTINAPELATYSDAIKQDLNAEGPSFARNAAASSRKASANLTNSQLKVYPNPFISTINIELSSLPDDGAMFTLYDESGKVISQQKINNSRISLSFPRALAGNYTYQLVDHKGSLISTGKLLKIQ